MKNKIEIIYEDEAIVVVNKPPNYLTLPDRYAHHLPNLLDTLNQRCGKVFVVHRIDKETSGILVFAKTEAAHKALNEQFQKRTAEKYYFALVEGHVHQESGTIDKPIGPSPNKKGRMIITKNGKASLTLYTVVEHFKNFTLLEANIKTGRTHQIRVHLNAIGYPLAIDAVYGRRTEFLLSAIKHRKYNKGQREERPLMSRSSLHAHRLVLQHPVNGETMEFKAPPPKDMKAVLQQLRKWG